MRALMLALGLLASAPAVAAPTCLVEVDGKRYVDGPCRAWTDRDGRMAIGSVRGGDATRTSSYMGPEFDRQAGGVWRNPTANRYEGLGPMRRSGPSCWEGRGSRVCMWR